MIEINGVNYISGLTHSGTFHADEVFSTALLRCIDPTFKVRRVGMIRPEHQKQDVLMFDIGNGEFDHHGFNRETRPNGVPYAAFGKLWRALGMSIVYDKASFEKFDEEYCQPIDLSDNTGTPNPLSEIISSFNVTWKDLSRPQNVINSMTENRFNEAVNVVRPMLLRAVEHAKSSSEARELIKELKEKSPDPRIIVCDMTLPMSEISQDLNLLVSIAPSYRGGWSVASVSDVENGRLVNRWKFPENIRGLPLDELQKTIPESTSIKFVHPNGFMASFDDLDDAIATTLSLINKSKDS